jgi:hypothetical protein
MSAKGGEQNCQHLHVEKFWLRVPCFLCREARGIRKFRLVLELALSRSEGVLSGIRPQLRVGRICFFNNQKINLFYNSEVKDRAESNKEKKPDPGTGNELFPFIFIERDKSDHGFQVYNDDCQEKADKCKEENHTPGDGRADKFQRWIHNIFHAWNREDSGIEDFYFVSIAEEGIHS